MNRLVLLFLPLVLLLLTGCGTVRQNPTEAEIRAAEQASIALFQDQDAIMPGWYRDRLRPGHRLEKGWLDEGVFRSVQHYDAIPDPRHPLFWNALWITLVIAFVLGMTVAISSRNDFSTGEEYLGKAVVFVLFQVVIIGVAIVVLKSAAHFAYEPNRYVPWEFAGFIGTITMPILGALSLIVYFIADVIFPRAASAVREIGKSAALRKSRRLDEKKRKDIDVAFDRDTFVNQIRSLSSLVDELHYSSDPIAHRQILMRLKDRLIDMTMLGRSRSEAIDNARKLLPLEQTLRGLGHGDTIACKYLEAMIDPYRRKLK